MHEVHVAGNEALLVLDEKFPSVSISPLFSSVSLSCPRSFSSCLLPVVPGKLSMRKWPADGE